VDEDTQAFNGIMDAFRLPKGSEDEKKERKKAIHKATLYAIEVPFRTMVTASSTLSLIKAMVEKGNPNSISDAGVGAICIRAAVQGAGLNVLINAAGLSNDAKKSEYIEKATQLEKKVILETEEILSLIKVKMLN
jgi:glutamate formiminotransferase / formiminotetrahydrofolate cyclodeaminase